MSPELERIKGDWAVGKVLGTAWGLSPSWAPVEFWNSVWGVRFLLCVCEAISECYSASQKEQKCLDQQAFGTPRPVSGRVWAQPPRAILQSAARACCFLGGIK